MEPGKTAKGAATRSRRRTGKGGAEKLTYDDAQRFLAKMEKWWGKVGTDVGSVKEMLGGLEPDEPVSPVFEGKFKKMMARFNGDIDCAFPFIQDICMPWATLHAKKRRRK